jgi:hypothetical protein
VAIGFFIPNTSSLIVVLELAQPVTEMSIRNLLGGRGQAALEADNLTAICQPNV